MSDLPMKTPEAAGLHALETGLVEFGLHGMTADEFLQTGIDELNRSVVHTVRAGLAFWAAQEALKNIESAAAESAEKDRVRRGALVNFKEWITEKDLQKERVYEAIRMAKFFVALPPDKRAQTLKLGKKPVLFLAALPQEVIDEAAESGHDVFADAELLTYAELRTKVANLSKNYDTLHNQKKTLELELERLRPRTRLPGAAEFDGRTYEARHESAALEYGARMHIDALDTLFNDLLDEGRRDAVDPETEARRLNAVGLAAGAVLARALDLYERVKDGLDGAMPVQPRGDLLLSEDEKVMLRAGVALLNANFQEGKARRRDEADQEAAKHQTGPGRRRGSKSKVAP